MVKTQSLQAQAEITDDIIRSSRLSRLYKVLPPPSFHSLNSTVPQVNFMYKINRVPLEMRGAVLFMSMNCMLPYK